MKTITKSIYLAFASVALACFALLPRAQAATPELLPAPPPDGFYNGFNTAEGFGALFALTSGTFNTALGFKALNADTSGGSNTAVGGQALLHNNVGSYNTAIGENALVFNTSGSFNMALGQGALASNTGGSSNTAMGFQALNTNTVSDNVGVGYQALRNNTTGGTFSGSFLAPFSSGPNTAIGTQALLSNVDGGGNTAVGYFALSSTASGIPEAYCTAVGFEALASDTATAGDQGTFNSALGAQALVKLTTGISNTAVGALAGDALTTGSQNTFLGTEAGINVSSATGVTCLGEHVFGKNVGNTTFIAHVRGVTTQVANAINVMIDSDGQLGTASSSRRFKHDIKPMDKASDAILALKPVSFHYKSDNTNTPQFGLIAEDVAAVNPDLVVRDKGEIYTVRYDAVNAMLLNEFLKEHKKVQEQQASIADLKSTVALQQKEMQVLTAQLKEQAAQIQKVSAQVETSKPAPTVVANQ